MFVCLFVCVSAQSVRLPLALAARCGPAGPSLPVARMRRTAGCTLARGATSQSCHCARCMRALGLTHSGGLRRIDRPQVWLEVDRYLSALRTMFDTKGALAAPSNGHSAARTTPPGGNITRLPPAAAGNFWKLPLGRRSIGPSAALGAASAAQTRQTVPARCKHRARHRCGREVPCAVPTAAYDVPTACVLYYTTQC